MNTRSIREFSYPYPVWDAVESWATAEGFRVIGTEGGKRMYQKGYGLLVLPTRLDVSQAGNDVRIEAWIQNQILTRLFTLFMSPTEVKLDSGGLLFLVPRALSRTVVNKLLEHFGQPPIT